MKEWIADAVERLSEVVKSRAQVVERQASVRKRIRSWKNDWKTPWKLERQAEVVKSGAEVVVRRANVRKRSRKGKKSVLRIRNKSFWSGSGLNLVSDPDRKLAKTSFLQKIFYPASFSNINKAAFPQLRDLATNKVRSIFAGFGSGTIGKRHGSASPDP